MNPKPKVKRSLSERVPGYLWISQVPPGASNASRMTKLMPGKRLRSMQALPMPEMPAPTITTSKRSAAADEGACARGCEDGFMSGTCQMRWTMHVSVVHGWHADCRLRAVPVVQPAPVHGRPDHRGGWVTAGPIRSCRRSGTNRCAVGAANSRSRSTGRCRTSASARRCWERCCGDPHQRGVAGQRAAGHACGLRHGVGARGRGVRRGAPASHLCLRQRVRHATRATRS